MPKSIHVIPHNAKGWATKRQNADHVSSTHGTQSEAIEFAREIAQREHLEVFIHRSDGTIRDRDSYGKDPFPPRDKKH